MVRSNVRGESGGSSTGDDDTRRAGESVSVTYARRVAIALAIALVLHALVAAFVPGISAQREPQIATRITRIRIEPRRTPAPAPPRVRAHHFAPISAPAAVTASAAHDLTRKRETLHRNGAARPRIARAQSKPVWDTVAAAGSGAGAGTGSGAGSTGDGANGNGGGSGVQPCGFVDFADIHGSRYSPRTGGFYVDIRMSVHFSDGHAESIVLDYPFYYPSEAANPWSAQHRDDPTFPTRLQTPPPALAASEPPLVQYVLQHSGPEGTTLLEDCPSAAPAAATNP